MLIELHAVLFEHCSAASWGNARDFFPRSLTDLQCQKLAQLNANTCPPLFGDGTGLMASRWIRHLNSNSFLIICVRGTEWGVSFILQLMKSDTSVAPARCAWVVAHRFWVGSDLRARRHARPVTRGRRTRVGVRCHVSRAHLSPHLSPKHTNNADQQRKAKLRRAPAPETGCSNTRHQNGGQRTGCYARGQRRPHVHLGHVHKWRRHKWMRQEIGESVWPTVRPYA